MGTSMRADLEAAGYSVIGATCYGLIVGTSGGPYEIRQAQAGRRPLWSIATSHPGHNGHGISLGQARHFRSLEAAIGGLVAP